MALQCQIAVSALSYAVGNSPSPRISLQVYNPNASAVVVTGVEPYSYVLNATSKGRNTQAKIVPPIGFGQTVSVPTLSSITIGPMSLAVGGGSNGSTFERITPPGTAPANSQVAMPLQFALMIGATVYGSDGSINEAGQIGVLISYRPPPPKLFQGGAFVFHGRNNFITGLLMGAL